LLRTQEYETDAGEDDEEPKFKILAAVKKFVPRPDTLSDGHGDGFDGDQEEQDSTAAHSKARNFEDRAEVCPSEDRKKITHAVQV